METYMLFILGFGLGVIFSFLVMIIPLQRKLDNLGDECFISGVYIVSNIRKYCRLK
jgi:hypothetical protein